MNMFTAYIIPAQRAAGAEIDIQVYMTYGEAEEAYNKYARYFYWMGEPKPVQWDIKPNPVWARIDAMKKEEENG